MAKLLIFDDDENKSRWFLFDEDTEVKINYLSRTELKKINAKSMKAGRLTKGDVLDYSNVLLGRKAVSDWRKKDDHAHPGLIVKGQPLPFNQGNLDMLMTKSTEFSRFVNDICTDASLFDEEDEAQIKND